MKQQILKLRKVTKDFHGEFLLNTDHLDLHQSEVHVLVGENGSGKSTHADHLRNHSP